MTGIFDADTSDLFADYHVKLRFRQRVVGGTPSDPKLIEGWLRAKMGVTSEQEVRALTLQTLRELGIEEEVFQDEAMEQIEFATLSQASEVIAKKSNTTMFKRDEHGLYLEARAVKAMLKEAVNILFAGDKWRRKGPMRATAEWVYIKPDRIPLGVQAADGIDLAIGHIVGREGPRSILDYYEYVEQATLEFDVSVLQDRIESKFWPAIWRVAQEGGLGAKRSQGFGQFDVIAWDRQHGSAR